MKHRLLPSLAVATLLLAAASSASVARARASDAAPAAAPTLVSFDAPEGARLFDESDAKAAFWPLARFFVSERMDTYCSVAAGVMALNALRMPSPPQPLVWPYHEFDQDSFFTDAVLRVKPAPQVAAAGMTLDELASALRAHGLEVDATHAADASLAQFRDAVRDAAAHTDRVLIVNLWRAALGQKGPGHFSPVAAYHAGSDRVLVLDVARYKYAPWWVGSDALFSAMKTVDPASNATRGYLVVRRPGGGAQDGPAR